MESFNLRTPFEFKHPTTILIAGPTMSGKTHFLVNCLKENLFWPKPTRIIWVYGEWQGIYDEVKSIWPHTEFVTEMSRALYDSLRVDENNLVVVDDQMTEAGGSDELANMFTKGAHHRNVSVVFIVQNLFHQGKSMRTISLNSHYLILFKNPRDMSQVRSLAIQMFPKNSSFLVNAYDDATRKPHGYLIMDLHPKTPEALRVRSGVFQLDVPIVYSPREEYKKGSK